MFANRQVLLILIAAAATFSYALWEGLLNNFSHEQAGFNGTSIGGLHTFREIPGFLAFTAVYLILVIKEQRLALLSLLLMGVGIAITGYFPTIWGLYFTTVIMSVGFHYFETLHLGLTWQWFPKQQTPVVLGRVQSARSLAMVGTLILLACVFRFGWLDYIPAYILGGGVSVVVAVAAIFLFRTIESVNIQNSNLVVRPQYWLYYALILLSGARRQIFIVIAGFMMVDKFGLHIEDMLLLLAFNSIIVAIVAPFVGRLLQRFGERIVLAFEYVGLIGVFVLYAFVEVAWQATALYFVDHVFFALAIGMNSYFKRIADDKDLAGSAATSFTFNHIAAVLLPLPIGILYDLVGPSPVFLIGAGIAGLSLLCALMVPSDPDKGNEVASWSGRGDRLMRRFLPNWGGG